mgnify:CR=1 FL=1
MSVTAVPIRPVRKGSVVKLWVALAALSLAAAGIAWAGTAGQGYVDASDGKLKLIGGPLGTAAFTDALCAGFEAAIVVARTCGRTLHSSCRPCPAAVIRWTVSWPVGGLSESFQPCISASI